MMDTRNKFENMGQDAADNGRQGFDAMMKSNTVFMQGMEQYMKTCAEIAKSSVERQGEAFKQLLACKTFSEVTETQSRLAKEGFEDMMQNATKLSEMGIRMTTEALEPINSEMNRSTQKAAATMQQANDSMAA